MKHQIGIAVAAFAVVAGGGVALAQAGPWEDTPPVEAPPTDPPEDTPVGPPSTLPPVEVEEPEETTETTETTEVEEPEVEEGEAPADNHGAVVSQAAHECPTGPGGVHGQCVSAVARDHDQDGTPDHGPGSPDHPGGGGANRGGPGN